MSLEKKIKSKTFIIVNILLFIALVALMNIDKIVLFFGGNFDKQNNICLIYETRPDICRVDLMFEKEYFKYYTKDEYFKLNIEACNKLQTMFDVDEKYRIKI